MHAVVHGERTLTDVDLGRLTKLLGRELARPRADLFAIAEITNQYQPEATGDYSR